MHLLGWNLHGEILGLGAEDPVSTVNPM